MKSKLTIGNHHTDARGTLIYNNDLDVSEVRRIYFIENNSMAFARGWQGHKIEHRWFAAIRGSFLIRIIAIDDWDTPTVTLNQEIYTLKTEDFMVLHVPEGYVSSIQALEENSKLMVMADYKIGEIQDEYRFLANYFQDNQ
jgi:dTDP-4-dehydrorhamnose 3,5-epimerase-like enzyme